MTRSCGTGIGGTCGAAAAASGVGVDVDGHASSGGAETGTVSGAQNETNGAHAAIGKGRGVGEDAAAEYEHDFAGSHILVGCKMTAIQAVGFAAGE